jgi:hypothetical protein
MDCCCATRIANANQFKPRAGEAFRCRECRTHWSSNGLEWRNLTAIFGTTIFRGDKKGS